MEEKFINAVSVRLIDGMAFSVLKIEEREGIDALARIRGQNLELVFFISDSKNRDFICYEQLPRIGEYMDRLNCTQARLVNIFMAGDHNTYDCDMETDLYDSISVSRIWVDIGQGMVWGDTSHLNRLDSLLKEYASIPRLERYSPINLETLTRVDKDVKPVITYGIIWINIIMWILMTLAGGSTNVAVLVRFGAMYAPLVIRGEYWRLITPMFLHVGAIHLAFNSYALYNLGTLAEKIYGRSKFIVVYAAAGVLGSVFSFLFTRAVSAGASGAIFGLLGALLYFGRKRPGVFRRGFTANLATILLINLFIGFSNPGIDNFAHIGGFIGGYISSHLILKRMRR
jgi:membrane associated rhomboid family serine protease